MPGIGGFHPAAFAVQELINLANEVEHQMVRLLGVNLTDYRALTALGKGGPVTVGTLAELLGATPATTTAILNRLESRGFVQRERTGDDRRRVEVSVTPAAITGILAINGPAMAQVNDQLLALSAAERDAVEGFLTATNAVLAGHVRKLAGTTTPKENP